MGVFADLLKGARRHATWHAAADAFEADGLDPSTFTLLELPESHGRAAWARQEGLAKAAAVGTPRPGAKYIKRVPTGNAKRPWRYYYAVQHGKGIDHHEHMVAGARFRHGDGHYEVTRQDGEHVTIKHDQTGHEETLSRTQLAAKLQEHHAAAIRAHAERMKLDPAVRRQLTPEAQKAKQAEVDAAAKSKAHAEAAASAPKPADAPSGKPPTTLSWTNSDKAHPADVGDIYRTKGGHTVVVTKRSKSYYTSASANEDFHGHYGGATWTHPVDVRPATEDELRHYDTERARSTVPREAHKALTAAIKEEATALRAVMSPLGEGTQLPSGTKEVARVPAPIFTGYGDAGAEHRARWGAGAPLVAIYEHDDTVHAVFQSGYGDDARFGPYSAPKDSDAGRRALALAESIKGTGATNAAILSAPALRNLIPSPKNSEARAQPDQASASPSWAPKGQSHHLAVGWDTDGANLHQRDKDQPGVTIRSMRKHGSAYVAKLDNAGGRTFLKEPRINGGRTEVYDLEPGHYEAQSAYWTGTQGATKRQRFTVHPTGAIEVHEDATPKPNAHGYTQVSSAKEGLTTAHHDRASALGLKLTAAGKNAIIGGRGTIAHKDARIKPHGGRYNGDGTWTVPLSKVADVLKGWRGDPDATTITTIMTRSGLDHASAVRVARARGLLAKGSAVRVPTHDMTAPDIGAPTKKRKKHPFVGTAEIAGLTIDIENAKGSYRTGTARDGTTWKTYMAYPYGEIRGSEGQDGDAVDAYLGPDADSPLVVVVHQLNPDTGAADEDKVMLGWRSESDAVKAYKAQYSKPGFYGGHTAMSVARFVRLVKDPDRRGTMIKGRHRSTGPFMAILGGLQ